VAWTHAKIDMSMRNPFSLGIWIAALSLFLSQGAGFGRDADVATNENDLVAQARLWRQREGLVAARDKLVHALTRQDSDHGMFERRVWATNADKTRIWPDSVAAVSPAQRARTGVFILLGYRQRSGRSQRVIRHVEKTLRAQGWHAKMIEVGEWSSPSEDTQAMDVVMRQELPLVDRALLIGFSKGGWDWINWLHGPAATLPREERAKIRLLVNFAAMLRGSAVAGWAAHDTGPEATIFRAIMLVRFGIKGASTTWLNSLSRDPWSRPNTKPLCSIAPRLRTIQFVALPEGGDGQTHVNHFFDWTGFSSSHWQTWMGPCDGMAESAAQLLPQHENVPQWIVGVKGSHALLDGRYLNDGIVSRRYRAKGSDWWRGGDEMMDDLMRALPRSTIGW
jgi:hypothetical protein